MAYIAIKNTEHKGVYKEKEFNKEIYKTKGISHRRFKVTELNEALKWAGVKDIKKTSISEPVAKNINSSKPVNETVEIIMDYKNKGFDGVCISTKNLGEIILKINQFDVLVTEGLNRFDTERDSIEEHFKIALEEAKIEKERYSYRTPYPLNIKIEIVKFNSLSKFNAINPKYINLSNFWARRKVENPFGNKQLMMSRIVKMDYNTNDFWNSYNNLTLNCDEIISIQPLEFAYPNNKNGIGLHVRSSWGIYEKMKPSKSKKIEKMFMDVNAQNLFITNYN